MLPGGMRFLGQAEEFVEAGIGDRLGVEPRTGHGAKLQLGLDDEAGQAEAAGGRREPVGPQVGAAHDLLAVGAQQAERRHMIAEGAGLMVVLTVHVVGDGTAHGDELGARQYRQAPAARNDEALDVAQHHAGLADQPAAFLVEADEAVETRRVPQHAVRVEALIAIAPPQAIGDAGTAARQFGGDPAAITESDHLVRKGREAAPRRDGPHGAAWARKTKRLSRWYFAQ